MLVDSLLKSKSLLYLTEAVGPSENATLTAELVSDPGLSHVPQRRVR